MKKKSISYSDLSKKQLENIKELYVPKKVEIDESSRTKTICY